MMCDEYNKKKTDLISVLIPAYNHEDYIQAAIDSAIKQTYQNIELIIVDDGSTDGTWDRIAAMEEACRARFTRVEIIRQDNQGVCLTLNKLVDLAKGEYILRLDSDDMMKPNSVETLHSFLSQNQDYGLAVGDNEIIDEKGQKVYWTENRENTTNESEAVHKTFGKYLMYWNQFPDGFDTDEFGKYNSFICKNYIPNGYLVRKKLMENIRFTPLAPREDYFMVLQLSKVSKFKYINEILHYYRWHSNNTIKIEGGANSDKYWKMTVRYELDLVKRSGNAELFNWLHDKLTNWRTGVKIKIGNWFEVYRIADFFGYKKVYMMKMGSHVWPLFELINRRNDAIGKNKWSVRRVTKDSEPC